MGNMINTIITTIITFVISGLLGYCVSRIKTYRDKAIKDKENENIQNLALLTLLQTELTNTYYKYQKNGEIPDYIYKNWLNLLSIYEKLGGNDYIHTLSKKMEGWVIVKTDIL